MAIAIQLVGVYCGVHLCDAEFGGHRGDQFVDFAVVVGLVATVVIYTVHILYSVLGSLRDSLLGIRQPNTVLGYGPFKREAVCCGLPHLVGRATTAVQVDNRQPLVSLLVGAGRH